MDPSLPEKILFFRSISPSIVDPSSARKYFSDLGLISLCPIIWNKIEPFIIVWENEIERLKKNCNNDCQDVLEEHIKDAVNNLKAKNEAVPDFNNFEDAKNICTSAYHLQSQFKIQNIGSTKCEEMDCEIITDESVLGKRSNIENLYNSYNFDTKESKLL